MPKDGEARRNPSTQSWEQYHDPPGIWKSVEEDYGPLDRPVDTMGFDAAHPDAAAE